MNTKLDGASMDIEQVERERLQSVFPQCFVEGKLDIDKLLSLCGEYIDNDFEKYKFEWKGKSESLRLAQGRSMGTLRPCPEVSVDCLLLVCLAEGLTSEIIEKMAIQYLPSKLVLSEKCFANDTAMANAHYILKDRDIELKLV